MKVQTMEGRVEMDKALRLTSYANRSPCSMVLQSNRGIKKGNQTIEITSKLTYENKINEGIDNIKDKSKG